MDARAFRVAGCRDRADSRGGLARAAVTASAVALPDGMRRTRCDAGGASRNGLRDDERTSRGVRRLHSRASLAAGSDPRRRAYASVACSTRQRQRRPDTDRTDAARRHQHRYGLLDPRDVMACGRRHPARAPDGRVLADPETPGGRTTRNAVSLAVAGGGDRGTPWA